MFYFNLLNKLWFINDLRGFFFGQVSCYVRYKGIYWQSLFRRLFHSEKAGKVGHGPKPDLVFFFLKYCTYIYIKIYTLSIQVILKQITKQIVDIKNFTSYFRRASVLVFLSSINKFFEQQTPIKAESSPQSFSRLLVGFTGKQFSIVNKSNFLV